MLPAACSSTLAARRNPLVHARRAGTVALRIRCSTDSASVLHAASWGARARRFAGHDASLTSRLAVKHKWLMRTKSRQQRSPRRCSRTPPRHLQTRHRNKVLQAPEQTPEEADEGRSTILGVGINLANAIVGSGIVGLPAALKDAGLGLGCFLLIGMAFTVHVVVVALVRDAEVLKAHCYGSLAKAALGSIGEVLVCGGQFVFDVGAALTYLIIFGDTAVSSVEFFVAKPCNIYG